jgi:hypothetical protein
MTRLVRSFLVALPMLFAPMLPALAQDASAVVTFSSATAGQPLPHGWQVMKINENKKLTQYRLVDDGGTVVLHANSAQSASAVGQYIAIDLEKTPIVEWRWKIKSLISTADMEAARTEDSPVRLVFAFDGDAKKLSLSDRASGAVAKSLSGKDLPFATLMYVWANAAPVDKIIRNPHTGQIRMIVASTGAGGVGKWQSLSRNVREDYKRAFGEYPGKMLSYGVMTDTDNTGESVEAWYGDIVFKPAK